MANLSKETVDEKKILSAEEEQELLKPIDNELGKIQEKINALRKDGSDKVRSYSYQIQVLKTDKTRTKEEKIPLEEEAKAGLEKAKKVEEKNKAEIDKLIEEGESYLEAHYEKDYFSKVEKSCQEEKKAALNKYVDTLAKMKASHEQELSNIKNSNAADKNQELKDENYVYKNKVYDAKLTYERDLQEVKDRRHEAFAYKYHLIDLLRNSNFTFSQKRAQSSENRRYTFNRKQFFLKNGLYIVILGIFIFLCIITPVVKGTQLLTFNNILNILQQASPRMFLALGVAGLILLTGTDLSIGRMVGMGMVASTVIMHQGINTGAVFGHIFDFSGMSIDGRIVLALVVNVILCTIFTSIAGFFTAKFKMHPFVSTMANMLIIFGLNTYATKGVSFGAIDSSIPNKIIPHWGMFPTIILWAVAATFLIWFIWNKTTFGKNLFAVGGNPEAAAASGISVFAVTFGAFVLAGILYGFGSWLECARMVGSGSAAYGQGWDMDAIAACVVGGVSFTGGIGKISGVVTGVMIFTALTYSLTILGIDTNLQFVFEGIIILAAVTLDCLKYVQKK
jgi:methyl-galactoside transport system permease protein